jgi:glucosyl-3-phosphoglycerate synthase
MSASLAGTLEFESGWGLEIGMLAEVFRKVDPVRIAQVDGGSGYDHKHQPAEAGLKKMCVEIAETLLRQLLAEGCGLDARFANSLSRAMQTEFAEAVRRSEILAQINGFAFDLGPETALSELFRGSVPPILSDFQKPAAYPARTLPSWQTVERLRPDALRKVVQ